jgi:glutamyl-tRNA synthetase
MTTRTRFAPSPTGYLHVGNVRAALLNWLFARKTAGDFILRIDDTDAERSSEIFVEAIQEDLTWLGLGWDALYRQSERQALYDVAAEKLRAAERLYACYETPEELEIKRKLQLARHKPPVYDRAALKLTDIERANFEAEGHKPHWRFLLDRTDVHWTDDIRGPSTIDAASLSDPVLIREDGTPLYTLPSVVDDGEMAITHVIRGEDHVANTAVQIQLAEALGYTPPTFAHFALFTGPQGEPLSKRLGSLAVRDFREQGFEPMALNSLLARLGSSDSVETRQHLEDCIPDFDLSHFGRSAPKFDPEEVKHLNARILHNLAYAEVADRLSALGIADADEAFWETIRPNLVVFADVVTWAKIMHGPIAPVIEDADYLKEAAELLPPTPWTEETWSAWTGAIKEKTGRKGKALFHPLRMALTGLDHGPEMKHLLPLIGPDSAKARLAFDQGADK